MPPGRRTRPSASRNARTCVVLNSSDTPPSSSADDVLERDQADDRAGRVDDERLMAAALAQERQQLVGGHRVDARLTIGLSSARSDSRGCSLMKSITTSFVCRMPMMLSDRAAVDRQPAVRARGDDAQHFLERRRSLDCREPRARHHQLPRGSQAEPQRAVQPHLFLRLEQSAVAALGDQQLDLLRRVHVAVAGRRHAQQLEQKDRRCR